MQSCCSEEVVFLRTASQAYSEPCQKFKMELFTKVVYSFQPFTIYAKKTRS